MSKPPYTIKLSDTDREYLQKISRSRTSQARTVDRSRILLQKEKGRTDKDISEGLGVSINTVRLCISKYFEGGVKEALSDAPRSGHPVEITDAAKTWILNIACQRPADLGCAQELWTLKSLHQYIQGHATQAGFQRLETITKARVGQILKASEIKPFKVKYYCENSIQGYSAFSMNGSTAITSIHAKPINQMRNCFLKAFINGQAEVPWV